MTVAEQLASLVDRTIVRVQWRPSERMYDYGDLTLTLNDGRQLKISPGWGGAMEPGLTVDLPMIGAS